MALNAKQLQVIECIKNENPLVLVCYGAKRAGKTYILIWAFLALLAKFRNQNLSFILGGATQASLRRMSLMIWSRYLGKA